MHEIRSATMTASPSRAVDVYTGSEWQHRYLPMKIAVAWLTGTYLLFLLTGRVGEVPDLLKLSLFVFATVGAFAVGYSVRARKFADQVTKSSVDLPVRTTPIRRLVLAGGVYYTIYGFSLLHFYGGSGLAEIARRIANPGTSYVARLRASEVLAEPSTAVQVLTVFAALATPLVPFLVLYWRRIGPFSRIVAILGLSVYGSYWLYIGTLKGLGDIAVYALAALLVLRKGAFAPTHEGRSRSRRYWVIGLCIALAFLGYMVYNQAQRLSASDISTYEPNPLVAAVAGDQLARGFTVTLAYPTHGYLGLAYNLQSPFVWSGFRGSSPALDSYASQYLGTDSVFQSTYPARTEVLTGWPSGMYWATIYPWLASDLTFPGAVLFMGVVGWWLARLWYEAAALRRHLSVLLLCQVAILIAYVPANNQIGLTRPGLIAFATLTALYAAGALHRAIARRAGQSRSTGARN